MSAMGLHHEAAGQTKRRVYSVAEIEVACRALEVMREWSKLEALQESVGKILATAHRIVAVGLAEIEAEHTLANIKAT